MNAPAISGNRIRLEVLAALLTRLAEREIPEAEVARMDADAELKTAAADLIDARRWARLREHGPALDALAESEGALEIRASRFDSEGEISNELRAEASRIRLARNDFEQKRRKQ